jgi:ribosomal protein S27E
MPQRTVRIRYSDDDLIGVMVYVTCPSCGSREFVTTHNADVHAIRECSVCGRPLLVISGSGHMYYVGRPVLERRVVRGEL